MRPKLSRSPRSRLSSSEISVPGKIFVSYEHKATVHIISYQGEISLVNLSKCFLGNRDNFFPYEQALSRGNLPSSPLLARLLAFLLTPKYNLQNFRWVFSIGVLSHFLKSFLAYAPHTSEPYNKIGDIMLSKILMAILGVKAWRSRCLRILYKACIAFSLSCCCAIENFAFDVSFTPRYVYSFVISTDELPKRKFKF